MEIRFRIVVFLANPLLPVRDNLSRTCLLLPPDGDPARTRGSGTLHQSCGSMHPISGHRGQ
jgi:hypothetical protein